MQKQKTPAHANDIDSIGRIFEKFAAPYHYQYSHADIFLDLLNTMLYIASMGNEFASEYAESCKRYGEESLQELISTIAECSINFFDALGTIYEYIVITKGKSSALGQFFTPQFVAMLMASLLQVGPEEGRKQNISDPCCGSGRTLLAAGMMYGGDRWKQMFWGGDIDIVSVKMTTLNLWLNTMPAIITHGDSLALTTWSGYEVIVNWEPDPQAESGGRWFSFVVKMSDDSIQTLQAIQQLPKSGQQAVMENINTERVKNVTAHKEKGGIKPLRERPSPPAPPTQEQQQLF